MAPEPAAPAAAPEAAAAGSAAEAAPPSRSARAVELALGRRELSIAVVAIALYVYFLNTATDFASTANIQTLGTFIAATAIIAAGQVFLMISGEIDLSVGQVFALTAFVMYFLEDAGVPLMLAVVLSLIAASLIGLVNGVITTVVGVSSFITTLGTFFFLNGLTLTISNGRPVDTPGGESFTSVFGGGSYSGILWAIGLTLALQVLLMRTRWGLHTFAVGGNLLGSREAGIRVRWVKTRNFMLASTLAGFAGILEAVRITSTDPLAGGSGIMFAAIAQRRHRRHAAGGRQRHGDRRLPRRLRARHPARRLHAPGRQRLHVRPHPGPRDPRRDGGRHLRHADAPPRRQGGDLTWPRSCASRAWPSGSGR